MAERFTDHEVREILTRAEAISLEQTCTAEATDTKSLIQSAIEAGYDRDAVEQAIRERMAAGHPSFAVGDLVFALSADNHAYPATVVNQSDSFVEVTFYAGSNAKVKPQDIYPLVLSPGSKVVCPWEGFGWWTCTVLSVDMLEEWVRVSDGWGSEETFPLEKIRMVKQRSPVSSPNVGNSLKFQIAMAFAGGGVIGAAIMWFTSRGL